MSRYTKKMAAVGFLSNAELRNLVQEKRCCVEEAMTGKPYLVLTDLPYNLWRDPIEDWAK